MDEETFRLMRVARGLEAPDLVIQNAQIVDVQTGEIYPGGMAVAGKRIAAIGDIECYVGSASSVIDAGGSFLTPGLIDGHVHIESSMLNVVHFAELALIHGTTSIMTDLHEVAAVGGLEVVYEVLQEADRTPFKIYFIVPSHVPFSPGFETTGGSIGPDEIPRALRFPRAIGLSEIVVSSVLDGDSRLLEAMKITRTKGGLLHGHAPFTSNGDLQAFAAAGIRTDHESFTCEDAIERLRAGIHVQIRHGSGAESIPDILPGLIEKGVSLRRASVITDDILAEDLLKKGYMDHIVRILQAHGLDPISAIQMATINTAEAFRVDDQIGLLAPGREADALIVDSLQTFEPRIVMAKGQVVASGGRLAMPHHTPMPSGKQLNSIRLPGPILPTDLEALARVDPAGGDRIDVHVLATPQNLPVPKLEIHSLPMRNGLIEPDPERDISAIAVIDRYTGNAGKALAFARGFGLRKGAMASSVAHDSHNLIAIGTNYSDMAIALNRIVELRGGQAAIADGQILAEIALPILGLMSPEPVSEVCAAINRLTSAARSLGCNMRWPLMFLSFMTCSAGPGYSITDKGLLDGYQQAFLSMVASIGSE